MQLNFTSTRAGCYKGDAVRTLGVAIPPIPGYPTTLDHFRTPCSGHVTRDVGIVAINIAGHCAWHDRVRSAGMIGCPHLGSSGRLVARTVGHVV